MEKKIILLSLAPIRLMPEFREQLEAAGDGREVLISTESTEIEPFLDRIEIGMGDIPFALIPRMPDFKWWQLWAAGADVLQRLPELKELPFRMCTTSGIHGQQMSEHLFAMLLGWNRRMREACDAQRKHQWLFVEDRQLSVLEGKTMLILGYGKIGWTIARVSLKFGMKVIGLRRNPPPRQEIEAPLRYFAEARDAHGVRLEPSSKLPEFLPQTDYVVNILPSTPDTRQCFGAAEFGLMRSNALYINLGRGATTCEAALIDALQKKRIAGALLDVTESEPLAKESPLWDMDNVIITCHYAGCRPGYSRMAMEVALENLEHYKRGEPLINLVDKNKGY
jgi:phosphoglycerate dehydrogenase-like enzyme